ncbi:T9SS type A sorting domain-containing protein [Dyadobacter sp. BHUBP1]|uniref:T9SS type A sorting domain-containing protein n=1 Tax=Dyadobacter sp. BHUBP1 TaxID=3424178 RepID=UPI003D34820C
MLVNISSQLLKFNQSETMAKVYPHQRFNTSKSTVLALAFNLWSALTMPVLAQCPTQIQIINVTPTAATCPSNGSLTINTGVGTGILYQITSGPQGYPTGAQNSETFSDLLPGEYTVKASCQANPATFANTTVTIADQYEDLVASSQVSGVCSSNGAGGVIMTTASSGRPPYQYAYFQGDPGIADNDPSILYGNANSYSSGVYGVFNVRVKDACGVFVTHQISIEKTYPNDLAINQAYPKYYDLNCTQVQNSVYIRFYLANGVGLESLPASGIDIDVYENNGTCETPVNGSLTMTVHLNPTDNPDILVPNRKNLIFVLRTPCGDQTTYCYEYDPALDSVDMNATIEAAGCEPASDGGINYGIWADVSELTVIPIHYELKNLGGTIIAQQTTSPTDRSNTSVYFSDLASGTYTVTATDACGKTISKTVTPPTGYPGVLTATPGTYVGCASINGRTTMNVRIEGVMANLAQATARIISPSASGVGKEGTNGGGGNYIWTDVIPGGTYTIEIDNQCGQTRTVVVTLPAGETQDQHIDATVRQLCGGIGDITISVNLKGNGSVDFDLLNEDGITVGSGTAPGGVFTNLVAGTYSAVAHVTGCGPYDFSKTNIQILPGGSLPVITKKLGIICEQPDGSPASSGKALLSFIGAQPLKVDYRLTSQTDIGYINLTNDSDGTETIDGLQAGTSYIVRVTDACGNSTPVQISIGALDALTSESSDKPCSGSSYTLSVPDMVDATYSWAKDGVYISSERAIYFPNYTTSDDGHYECTIVVGGCVTRIVSVNLTDCKLPVRLVNFVATAKENVNHLSWSTSEETNSSHFEVQRSLDAKTWSTIGLSPSKGEGAGIVTYEFEDRKPFTLLNYYRLKMVDRDSTFSYSRIVYVGETSFADVNIYPNPATTRVFVLRSIVKNLNSALVVGIDGSVVKKVGSSDLESGIDVRELPSGIYTLVLMLNDGSSLRQKVAVTR